jgi:xanthine dehydrogenase molybdopterin-binding subunit B
VVGMFDLGSQFPEETRPEYLPIFVTGAHLAQVLVDMETGLVQVKRLVAVHDVGRAINPGDATGQIQGAAIMGLGSALLEEYIPGASSGFENYILPMVQAIPEMEVILVEVPSYYGPHGAKGLGEAAMLPTRLPSLTQSLAPLDTGSGKSRLPRNASWKRSWPLKRCEKSSFLGDSQNKRPPGLPV